MVERTDDTQKLGRQDVARLLRELADEFDRDHANVDVPVGNKTIALSPPETVTAEVEVLERSGMFRGDQERVRVDLRWERSKEQVDTGEAIGERET